MDERGNNDERLATAFEVCRAGSHDPSDAEYAFLAAKLAADPKLAELHNRLQGIDAKIAAAFHDVPVAEDLAERVLLRLAAERPKASVSRRWLLVGGGLSALAAGLLVALWRGFQQSDPFSEQFVLGEAIRWFANGTLESRLPCADEPPPADYPFSKAVVQGPKTAWRAIDGFLGSRGIAYDVTTAGGEKAVLYVIACTVKTRGVAPALQPFTTAGCSASVWQEDGLVYILVVQGDPSAYRRSLRLPTGQIA